jgi:alpha-L-fucosidase
MKSRGKNMRFKFILCLIIAGLFCSVCIDLFAQEADTKDAYITIRNELNAFKRKLIEKNKKDKEFSKMLQEQKDIIDKIDAVIINKFPDYSSLKGKQRDLERERKEKDLKREKNQEYNDLSSKRYKVINKIDSWLILDNSEYKALVKEHDAKYMDYKGKSFKRTMIIPDDKRTKVTKYTSDWISLGQHQVPQWAKDAKFGIYAHWGVYAVSGAWDQKNPNWGNGYICAYQRIYSTKKNNEQHALFRKHVGPIEDGYGYKDLAKQFKAENFDPVEWADLIKKSGAKYAGICAIHHDGYAMWDSEVTDLCAGKTGPKRDLYGELITEIEKKGLKTLASFHHARTYKHFSGIVKKLKADPEFSGVDLLDPKYENYYWYIGEEEKFAKKRYALTKEVIDKYKPDVIWFDGGGGKFGTEQILADHFNMAIKENKEVCVHNKGNFGENFGVYSYENGHSRPLYIDWPWEDDTPSGTGWCDWPWFKNIKYKKPRDIVVRLCDLVARNGGLLLSMNPPPDGKLEQGQIDLLLGIGKWLRQNGDAIYSTVPWKIYAEGHTNVLEYYETLGTKKSRSIQPDPKKLNHEDVRFTRNGENLYATVLGIPPKGKTIIKSLNSKTKISKANKIKSIELLGHGPVKWERTSKALIITLPKKMPNEWALSFKINVTDELDKSKPKVDGSKMRLPKKT